MEAIKQQPSESSYTLGRAKDIYRTIGVVVLTAVVLIAIINVLLFGVFFIKDSAGAVERPQRPKDDGTLFNSDGSPVDNGKRTNYQLTWFDYGSYENIPEQYAADVLD